jgi:hypothetical protein
MNRAVVMLVVFLAVAAGSFGLGLWVLGNGDDVTALLLCGLAALSLRGLHLAAHVAEGGR